TAASASYSTTAQANALYQPIGSYQAASANLTSWSAIAPGAKQDADSDLTAWAAVNPNAYTNTAGIAAAYQPLDSDLTAVAALTTTSYGRGYNALADASAGRAYLGLGTAATSASSAFAAAAHSHAQSDVTSLTSDLALKAPLASPTFTGTPA